MRTVGIDEVLEQRVSDCLDRAVSDERLVGGVVLVAKNGDTVVEIAAGLADREAGRKMRDDTIFRYSSLTKTVVAATTMALVERGVIQLDDPVTRWLPAFRPRLSNGDEPRLEVRHLLTHTAGLTYAMFQPEGGTYDRAGISDGLDQSRISITEEIERLANVPLVYPPGSAWGYSVAYDVSRRIDRARRWRDVAKPGRHVCDRAVRHARYSVFDCRSGATGSALCERHAAATDGRS